MKFPLDSTEVNEKLNPIKGFTQSLYIIRSDNNPSELKDAFSRYKESKERACSKINGHDSNVLYVGSSSTGLKNRLSGHFGFGYPGTYSLHMNHWFGGKIDVEVFEFKGIDRELLQLIEDALSDSLSPMFGKRGSNSR